MNNKKLIAVGLAIALCLSLCLSACGDKKTPAGDPNASQTTTAAKPDKVYNWKFQSTENETISLYRERMEMCKKISEETNGGLNITQYSGGAIVSDANIPDAVKEGTVEMGNVYLNPLYASVPSSQMVGITPGFIFSVADSILFLKGYGALEIFQKQAEDVLNVILWPELTGAVLVCTNKEVHEAEDFKGLKIRSYGPLGNIYTKLGASVVNISGSEVYTALQTGMIDAANWGAYQGGIGANLQEVTKYFVEPCMGIGCGTVNMVNKDAYDSLPPQYQATLDKYFSNRVTGCVYTSNTQEFATKQKMIDAGMKASPLSANAKAKFREMALAEMEKLSKTDPSCTEIYNRLLTFLKHQDALKWK